MENLVTDTIFHNTYKGKKILITGHTGFKGSWLALWLKMMGAEVNGLSLNPSTNPSHFDLLKPEIKSYIGDIRDGDFVKKTINACKPEIIFHLAAQPLVIESYKNPVYTYETNVIGMLNVFEACRASTSVKAIVCITTDKVYENNESEHGYKEIDRLGGHDMYSSSKTCTEILISSYRDTFFNLTEYTNKHNVLIASARAGNVVGGGDWADYRLIPDIVKAASKNEKVLIRSPFSVRPWQHVLEPLKGYLMLGEKLLSGATEFSGAWNFGPGNTENMNVQKVIELSEKIWDKIKFDIVPNEFHETKNLALDSSKANKILGWKPVWDINTTFRRTINWYKDFYVNEKINTESDLIEYIKDCK